MTTRKRDLIRLLGAIPEETVAAAEGILVARKRWGGRPDVAIDWAPRSPCEVRVTVSGRYANLVNKTYGRRSGWSVGSWSMSGDTPPIYLTHSLFSWPGARAVGLDEPIEWPTLPGAVDSMVEFMDHPSFYSPHVGVD